MQVFEKNSTAGGRARQLRTANGYVFDMGPSWYWMPGVFERYFNDFGYSVPDFYDLKLLDPGFDMVFAPGEALSIPSGFDPLCDLFESIEKGSAVQLQKFMQEARFKYEIGMERLVYKPGLSVREFADPVLIRDALRLQIFSSFSKHVRRYFSHPKLIALMEFPVLFLGAMPQETPALYSLMNYAGLQLGTWYPQGGFGEVTRAMVQLAESNKTIFHFNAEVQLIDVKDHKASGLFVNGGKLPFDAVLAAADYHHVESQLLPPSCRNYKEAYWEKKTFAPSCLLFYLGLNKPVTNLRHHTLFFEEDLFRHSREIYKEAQWPSRPLFYACCPSKSDNTVAPAGHENLFLLMPIAPGLEDTPLLREKYFRIMLERLQNHTGEKNLERHIDFKKSYCVLDFVADYHSYKGNAYGLANTLRQTALLKPRMRNKRIKNLFYAGQLTVPGPGVPPSLISGKMAAEQLLKYLNNKKHEVVV